MRFIVTVFIVFSTLFSSSQSSDDAIRIMNNGVSGTARTIGLGGAQSVLGADIGAFQFNPASIGLFRSSQVSLSGAMMLDKNTSSYLGTEFITNQQYATVNNFGLAFATTDDSKNKIKSFTIGFSYHRNTNFENDLDYNGINNNNSFTTYLGEQTTLQKSINSDALNTNGFIDEKEIKNLAELAWISELIKIPIDDSLFYGTANDGGVMQERIFDEGGYKNNWDITFGGNYNDFIYLGGALGIHYYEYRYLDRLTEKDVEDTIPNFISYTYQDEYSISGIGTNLKLGTIVRPVDWFRIGVAIETPTTYNLEKSRKITLEDVVTDDDTLLVAVEKQFELNFDDENLTFKTPTKLILGMVVLVNKYGLLTADIEQINYVNSIFSNNSSINSNLKNTTNFRLGAEGRYNEWRLRLGVALNGSPYVDKTETGRRYLTLGAGYKTSTYFCDVAYIQSRTSRIERPYDLQLGIESSSENLKSSNTFSVTIGSTF